MMIRGWDGTKLGHQLVEQSEVQCEGSDNDNESGRN